MVHVRKVADTVHDLPNVLWRVASESSGGQSTIESIPIPIVRGVGPIALDVERTGLR